MAYKVNAMKLGEQLDTIGKILEDGEAAIRTSAPAVSGWDVGQHVDHTLKVCARIFGFVENDNALDEPGINPRGRVVLFLGRIPRGRGKSPEPVVGTVQSPEVLKQMLASVRQKAPRVSARPDSPSKIFRHPYFGCLTARQALRFIEVHTNHHLKIIKSIQLAAK